MLEKSNPLVRWGVREEREMEGKAAVGVEWYWVALSPKLKRMRLCKLLVSLAGQCYQAWRSLEGGQEALQGQRSRAAPFFSLLCPGVVSFFKHVFHLKKLKPVGICQRDSYLYPISQSTNIY